TGRRQRHEYDAFVCYHHDDARFLLDRMLPVLETEHGFRLCIHDRDFVPGWDIVDNIVESCEKSRKILLLLSNCFARSEWCQFEAMMAQQRVYIEKANALVPVLLEPLKIELVTPRLSALLKEKTYLEWTEHDHYGQKLFWCRLVKTLKGA
ncbi:uncharacterized protein LOC115215177 isoform X1, partial [Argonauta hians]